MKKFKYLEIIDNIKRDIFPTLKPNELLPIEKELCDRYKVSDITIKKALTMLAKTGIVKRIPGKGTVYKPHTVTVSTVSGRTKIRILTLNGWATGELLEKICAEYARKKTDIEFEFHRVSEAYYNDHPIDSYDLLLVNTWMLREYLTTPEHFQALLPLNELPGFYMDKDIYFQEALKWCRSEQKLYCLPLGVSPVVSIFNMSYPGFKNRMLQNCNTANDFLNILTSSIYEQRGTSSHFPFLIELSENRFPSFIKMLGGEVFDPVTGECTICNPKALKALEKIKKIMSSRLAPNVTANIEFTTADLFSSGKIGCMWGTYKHVRDCIEKKLNVRLQLLPEQTTRCSHLLIEGLMVTSKAECLPQISDFMNYIQTSAAQLEICRAADTFSAQKDLAKLYLENFSKSQPTAMSLYHGISFAEPSVIIPRWKKWKALTNTMLQFWMGMDSIENICKKISNELNNG